MTDTPARPPDCDSWTEYVDILLRWRSLVLIGVGASWLAVAAAVLLWPRTFECEATLAMPSVSQDPKDGILKPGIPLAPYKKLQRTLNDLAVLTAALQDVLKESEIKTIQRDIDRYVVALTTNTRDDWRRIDKDDNVIAVRLYYAAASPEKARQVVTRLSALVRQTLLGVLARDRIEAQIIEALKVTNKAQTDRLFLASSNQSLETLSQRLDALDRHFPREAEPKDVIDVREGGWRYLRPKVQLVGVEARRAENDHDIRMAERTARIGRLTAAFLRRLEERLRVYSEAKRTSGRESITALYDAEVKAFLERNKDVDSEAVAVELRGMAETLRANEESMDEMQTPTIARRPRSWPLVLGALASSLFVFLIVPFIAEAWRRTHAAPAPVSVEIGARVAGGRF